MTLEGQANSSGIQVFIPGGSAVSITDKNGFYRLSGLAPGSYSVLAQFAGYQTLELGQIDVAVSEKNERYFLPARSLLRASGAAAPAAAPEALGNLRGKVTAIWDAGSAPRPDLSGCRIEIEGTEFRTFSGPEGEFFLFNLKPGNYQINASLEGYQAGKSAVEVRSGENPPIAIELSPLPSDQNWREITGTVELHQPDGSLSTNYQSLEVSLVELPRLKVTVQPDGTFRIGPLAPQTYTLRASAEGYLPVEDLALDLKTASVPVPLALYASQPEPEKPGRVVGIARKSIERNNDMSGISVALAGTSFVAMTDETGDYQITNVPPGTYTLVAQAEGFETQRLTSLVVAAGEEANIGEILLKPVVHPPTVVEASPHNGTSDFLVSMRMPIQVRFSKKMRPESLKAAFSITPPADFDIYAGKEHPESDFDLLLVILDGRSQEHPIQFNTNYRATIASSAEDFEGLRLERPFTLDFKTGKAAIVETSPSDGEKNVVLSPIQAVQIRFNARLDPDTIKASEIQVRPGGINPTIQVAEDSKTGWTILHLQSTWEQDTRYEIRISRRLKTASGQPLANTPFTLRFRTARYENAPPLDILPR